MYKSVIAYIDKCIQCRSHKMKQDVLPMQDMPMPEFPFEIISIDTSGPFSETDSGIKYIVTIIDHF